MKDESLREALHSATRREPAAGDPYARFETVRRRNAVARGVVVLGIGAALMFAFLKVFPNPLNSGPPVEYPVGGEFDPTRSPVLVFQDEAAGYQLEYPPEWKLRGTAGGTITFYVETDPPLGNLPVADIVNGPRYQTETPKTFFVQVTPMTRGNTPRVIERSGLDALDRAGAIVSTDPVFLDEAGQRRADQLRVYFAPSPVGRGLNQIPFWCTSCRLHEVTVTLVPARGVPPLHIRIVAPDDATLQQYMSDAVQIVNTIERYIAR